jgi:hypothetical protein
MAAAVAMDVPTASVSRPRQHHESTIRQQDHPTGAHGTAVQSAATPCLVVNHNANPAPTPARPEATFPMQPRQLPTTLLGLPAAETVPANVAQQFGFLSLDARTAVAVFPGVGLRGSAHQQHAERSANKSA